MRVLITGLLLTNASLVALAASTQPSDGLDGTWENTGLMNIMGGRTDKLVKFGPATRPTTRPSTRSVTFSTVTHPRATERSRGAVAQTKTLGPFEAAVEGPFVTVTFPTGVARYTFIADPNVLSFPALVQTDDRTIEARAPWVAGVDFDPDLPHLQNQPALSTISYKWTFSAAPESATRGTGRFSRTTEPDLPHTSIEFDFTWEWGDYDGGPHIPMRVRGVLMRRVYANGQRNEYGWLLWPKPRIPAFVGSGGGWDGPGIQQYKRGTADVPAVPSTRPQP